MAMTPESDGGEEEQNADAQAQFHGQHSLQSGNAPRWASDDCMVRTTTKGIAKLRAFEFAEINRVSGNCPADDRPSPERPDGATGLRQ